MGSSPLLSPICFSDCLVNKKRISDRLVTVDQTLHLMLIFCATVNSQQCPVLSPAAFLSQLENGQVTRQLCHAMCAASIPYSRHASCTGPRMRIAFAEDAREESALLMPFDNHTRYQQLLTLSVLSLYETSQGNGIQAWYDLSGSSPFTPRTPPLLLTVSW